MAERTAALPEQLCAVGPDPAVLGTVTRASRVKPLGLCCCGETNCQVADDRSRLDLDPCSWPGVSGSSTPKIKGSSGSPHKLCRKAQGWVTELLPSGCLRLKEENAQNKGDLGESLKHKKGTGF